MSAAHEGHEAEAHDAKDAAGDHDAFDGEPTQVLPPDEPRTPGWVPALGLLLFLTALIVLLVRSGSDAEATEPERAAAKPAQAVEAAAAAAPVRTAPAPAAMPPGRPSPALGASAAIPNLTPEQIQQLRKAVEERVKLPGGMPPMPGAAPGAPGAAPAAPGSPPSPAGPR